MKTITATELKYKTSETIATAQHEPVSVEKNGRAVVVILPQADYERLTKIENDYWLARLESANDSGYIGTEATANFFKQRLAGDAKP
jgi:prevent-host-death family protein